MAGFVDGILYLDPGFLTTVSGDNDDVSPGGLMIISTAHNNDAITGLVAPSGWPIILLVNADASNNLILKHLSTGSAVGNRISIYNAADLTIPPLQSALLGYDLVNGIWRSVKFA